MESEESPNKPELITQFCNVTGVDRDRAQFYLESSAWQINVALAGFYDNEEVDNFEPEVIEPEPEIEEIDPDPEPEQPQKTKKNKKKKTTDSRFATLQTIGSDDSSEEEGQAFYAGGSERSGQQVLGPPRKKSEDVIKEMFKSAASHGAEEVEDPADSKRANTSFFQGSGFRLGSAANDSQMVQPSSSSAKKEQQVDVVLKLWENGFSVDDGPLRKFNDPQNLDFLESIRRGEIPQELTQQQRGGEVNLNMEDHRHEEYKPAKQKVKAFAGAGHVLGSPVCEIVSPEPAETKTKEPGASSQKPSSITVDESKPTTNIQLRLADGSRVVLKMNHSHTIQDIRNYITSNHAEYKFSHFILLTTFPNKELTEESLSLADAKLLNAVIVQRIKK